MSTLFDDFEPSTPAAWKQKIQFDLNGEDYNKTLLWQSNEGIIVKPFYTKENRTNLQIVTPTKGFRCCQTVFIDNEKTANSIARNALKRGATAIQFIANKRYDCSLVLEKIDLNTTYIYFKLNFLDPNFINSKQALINPKNTFFQIDIIGNLCEQGNWFYNLKEDFKRLKDITQSCQYTLVVQASIYQNAGANITQQLAYALAHANEYLCYLGKEVATNIHFNFSVGGNYFFEIAKLRAFRVLWASLLKQYDLPDNEALLFVQPSTRNKTLYDYNINMLRTTSECMSAILGGANTISNLPYDAIYNKSNEFGERIARNQLLILQEESFFKEAQHIADGSYYIETITNQLAEKALALFKELEKKGGFLKQLKQGKIQQKINESAAKEQSQFDHQIIKLVGTNIQTNANDRMKDAIHLYPFLKQRNYKTLLQPILKKRLSEKVEQERLANETNIVTKK